MYDGPLPAEVSAPAPASAPAAAASAVSSGQQTKSCVDAGVETGSGVGGSAGGGGGGSSSGDSGSSGMPKLVAGEIGYSIGSVYTSLSGFSTRGTVAAGSGHVQLVCLGKWLQLKGYSFWSMGHCYSPAMDYKRQLGHRVYPRVDFLAKLKRHRGRFRVEVQAMSAGAGTGAGDGGGFEGALGEGEECDVLAALGWGPVE